MGPDVDADGAARAATDTGLYRRILEDMAAGLAREHRDQGVRKLVEVLRNVHRQAGLDPPEWLDRVVSPAERPAEPRT